MNDPIQSPLSQHGVFAVLNLKLNQVHVSWESRVVADFPVTGWGLGCVPLMRLEDIIARVPETVAVLAAGGEEFQKVLIVEVSRVLQIECFPDVLPSLTQECSRHDLVARA